MNDKAYYDHLLTRYLENRCTPAELEELMGYLEGDTSNRFLLLQIKEKFQESATLLPPITKAQSDRIRQQLINRVHAPTIRMQAKWYWAAASFLLMMMAGWWYRAVKTGNEKSIAKTIRRSRPTNDIMPGTSKAMLTLANGATVALDTARDGALTMQGNTRLVKLNNKITYNAAGVRSAAILYNTLSTPRGGQFHIELPDGTGVWLNAASSIYYPTAFTGKERRVTVTGEVYFEVATNKSQPFIAVVGHSEIRVLGTHFNVMAYDHESSVNTTLLEGQIKFTNGNQGGFLKPGQQSQYTRDGALRVVDDVDLENVIAWKQGSFHFENADLKTVLRQLCRWYDVEVEYRNKEKEELLHADIPRNTKLSDALTVVELASGEHFKIEGRKIVVGR